MASSRYLKLGVCGCVVNPPIGLAFFGEQSLNLFAAEGLPGVLLRLLSSPDATLFLCDVGGMTVVGSTDVDVLTLVLVCERPCRLVFATAPVHVSCGRGEGSTGVDDEGTMLRSGVLGVLDRELDDLFGFLFRLCTMCLLPGPSCFLGASELPHCCAVLRCSSCM
jgi:hypothetical protein